MKTQTSFIKPLAIAMALAALLVATPVQAAPETEKSLYERLGGVFAIAAVALDLLVGYGALISFGHAAFIGLGAYAVAILAAHGVNEALISLPASTPVSSTICSVRRKPR